MSMRKLLGSTQIKKGEKVEYWHTLNIGKQFRISNHLAGKIRYNYKPYLHFYGMFIPKKDLIITKEERDRILIAPADAEIYPKQYQTIAKDDKYMIVLLENDYDYLMVIGEKRKLIPLPRSGRRLEEDIDIRLVELYKINEETFRKGYRMTLIPADYEVYPKDSVVYIAKAEVVDEAFKYEENRYKLIPIKKEVYLVYRNKNYLMVRKGNEAVLIYNGLYGDMYKTIKFNEDIEIDNEAMFEMLTRSRNSCYFYMNKVISYSNPERISFYKHSLLPITLANGRIVSAVRDDERKEILVPGDRKILFIHGTYPLTKEKNTFYTIHSEKIQIHDNSPELVLDYTGVRTVDVTGLEDEEIIIKKWKYEIVEEEGDDIFVIDTIDEIKAKVVGVVEEKRVKIADFLKEFTPYKIENRIERECRIEDEDVIEDARAYEKCYISIPAF